MSIGPFSKAGDIFEFALGHGGAKCRRIALIFNNFFAAQPILNVFPARNDPGMIPFANWIDALVGTGGDYVVERAEFAVAVVAQLGVRMAFIVENLVFETDGRTNGCFS